MTASLTQTPRSAMAGAAARRRPRRAWVPYAFLAPTAAVLAAGFLLPILEVLRRSFYEGSIAVDGRFVGVQNYSDLFSDGAFWTTVWVTLLFTAGSVIGGLALGLGTALVLNRAFRGRGVVRMLIIVPWALPIVPAVLVWRWALDNQYGVINHLLRTAGLIDANIAWLNSPVWALPVVIVIQIWRSFPFAAVLFLAGLQNVRKELYEAAAIDGAGAFAQFRYVTLPGLRPVIAVLALLKTVWALGADVTVIFLATRGGPAGETRVLSLAAYIEAFDRYDFGRAATLGAVVLVLATVPALVYLRTRRAHDA
ncbi:carbohydrate ABC transporter permease [Jiangella asiatica]|uniref:Sugar ABC transporter permease n=1 Tax=Jiangella asiatica TaxID=2530372 RepID=A0A4R5CX04_9ACTN|nr:sugar ABC transporter permease [Jiangella asiatica]TDE03104.1 sugar ABC transporter permease [Jiangella asiatica]